LAFAADKPLGNRCHSIAAALYFSNTCGERFVANSTATKMIVLSAINDISEVSKLYELWQEYLASPLIVIDANSVEKIDTAVLQLLTALIGEAGKNNTEVKWEGVSENMKHAVKLLGLNGPLKIH